MAMHSPQESISKCHSLVHSVRHTGIFGHGHPTRFVLFVIEVIIIIIILVIIIIIIIPKASVLSPTFSPQGVLA